MPRVKLIYIGDDQWITPTADIKTCSHPRETLRFDPRFGTPIYVYCCACGQPYLHPFHGMTQDDIDSAKERGRVLWEQLNGI